MILIINTQGLASHLHEIWARVFFEDGGKARIKTTTDASWIEVNGTDQVDIANTPFLDLPSDWQLENVEAANSTRAILEGAEFTVVALLEELNNVTSSARTLFGEAVHEAWLQRNAWAKGSELAVPFCELSFEEQEKDINLLRAALQFATYN